MMQHCGNLMQSSAASHYTWQLSETTLLSGFEYFQSPKFHFGNTKFVLQFLMPQKEQSDNDVKNSACEKNKQEQYIGLYLVHKGKNTISGIDIQAKIDVNMSNGIYKSTIIFQTFREYNEKTGENNFLKRSQLPSIADSRNMNVQVWIKETESCKVINQSKYQIYLLFNEMIFAEFRCNFST